MDYWQITIKLQHTMLTILWVKTFANIDITVNIIAYDNMD